MHDEVITRLRKNGRKGKRGLKISNGDIEYMESWTPITSWDLWYIAKPVFLLGLVWGIMDKGNLELAVLVAALGICYLMMSKGHEYY